ncbi:hypothetical protein OROGR_019797 [Orobanche gracilis]
MFGPNSHELPNNYSPYFQGYYFPQPEINQSFPPPQLFLPTLATSGEHNSLSALRSELGYTSSGCSSYGGSPTSITSYGTYSPTTMIQHSISSHSFQKNSEIYSSMDLSSQGQYFELEDTSSLWKAPTAGNTLQANGLIPSTVNGMGPFLQKKGPFQNVRLKLQSQNSHGTSIAINSISLQLSHYESADSTGADEILSKPREVNLGQHNLWSNSPVAATESSIMESMNRASPYSPEEKKERIERYRNKRNLRNFNKKIKYECRKTLADSRPRIKGRFARNDHDHDQIDKTPQTQSQCDQTGVEEDDDNNWVKFLDAFSANMMP